MGTSIVARLLVEEHMMVAAGAFVALACAIFVVLTAGFIRYRQPSFGRTSMAEWSMFFIGILALGAALSGLTGNGIFRLVAFWIGGPVTVVTWAIQLTRFDGPPKFPWGLPLVGPMISASVAGWLAKDYGQFYHVLGTVLFLMSLCTAVPTFARVYWAAWHGKVDLSGPNSATSWVPLGVIGQSTTAMQILYPGTFSIYYGRVALFLALPLGLYAMAQFYPNVLRWVDYSPAWWACTFPPGTVSMGGHQMALVSGQHWLDVVALTVPILLITHWTLCASRFVTWVAEGRREAARNAPLPR
ncbi:membrane protein [Corynebacterium jeddahense]|uniref:C4-dicarboxylate transporter/malic acid transport protein n=2 Tax=Corynebacterium jeddahense TaxID=1414719 RepID=A0ABY7UKP1_9CORY|nr:membrane protein [Corynebacterium jeddahense]WCZ39293.1 C4-dicarboxylate transporter/malic acid transport protein [Corynebacterium jeddahense]